MEKKPRLRAHRRSHAVAVSSQAPAGTAEANSALRLQEATGATSLQPHSFRPLTSYRRLRDQQSLGLTFLNLDKALRPPEVTPSRPGPWSWLRRGNFEISLWPMCLVETWKLRKTNPFLNGELGNVCFDSFSFKIIADE